MSLKEYRRGKVNVDNGSDVINGNNTFWLTYVKAGEVITIKSVDYTILEVLKNNQMKVNRVYEGASESGLKYIITKNAVTVSLSQTRMAYKRQVDSEAGRARNVFLTSVPGQAETYLQKYQQAVDYKDSGYPTDTTPYPLVEAEAQVLQAADPTVTKVDASNFVIQQREAWMLVGREIEIIRRSAKLDIGAVTTSDAARSRLLAAVSSLRAVVEAYAQDADAIEEYKAKTANI